MVNTRSAVPPKMTSFADISNKIDSSGLTTETKQIFKIMLELFKSVNSERDLKVAQLEQKVEDYNIKATAALDSMRNEINSLNSELSASKSANIELNSQLVKARNAHDELEAYGRRESLIFSGDKVPPFETNENCANIARQLIRDVLKLNIDPPISTAHRVGKPPAPGSTAPDTRGIIVKFCRRDDNPPGNQLLGTSFQKARRAFWGEARPGFGVHWCVYV